MNAISPTAMVLLAVVSIQLGFAVSYNLFPVFGPLGVLFLRVTIAGIVLALFTGRNLGSAFLQDPAGVGLLGLCMTLQYAFFLEAIARIPLGITVSIAFIGPLGLALVTSRHAIDLLWVLMAAAGIGLFVPSVGAGLDTIGLLFAFGAAIGWAGFVLCSQRLGSSTKGATGIPLATLASAMLLFPFAGTETIRLSLSHPGALATMFAVAIFSSAIPLALEYRALNLMSRQRYGVLVSTEPVVATAIGAAFLGERVGARGLLAIMLITIASVGITLTSRRTEKT